MEQQSTRDHTNRLAGSFSPYLRQHMNNPVDWYPWGEEALEKARRENKPILVSIGYSTCYWCHVLEREVFSQDDVAALMNETVVAIKVDREVRPDIDDIYMTATQVMTGSGGWPNNVLLTPDLAPFYAVTYLPKAQWMNLMEGVGQAWENERDQVVAQANQVGQALRNYLGGAAPVQADFQFTTLAGGVFQARAQSYDNRHGGFGTGTKFPMESSLLFLLDYAAARKSADPPGAQQALDMLQNTVDHMIAGGIHDHVGGGFHRYSTDREWLLPHFEKMLYNQGMMAVVLARLHEMTGAAEYRRALERLLAYVDRQMTGESGAFYSALDAETAAVEGAYYVWNRRELEEILGHADSIFLLDHYGLTALAHFQDHAYPDGEVLYRKSGRLDEAARKRLDGMFEKLLAARAKREMPLRDNKILAAWNGVMIYGYAEAGRVLDNPAYVRAAEKAARFILNAMRREDDGLYRIHIDGQSHQHAFLEDYAWLAKGFMALFRASGKEEWKTQAIRLLRVADRDFLDQNSGGYFLTDGSEGLPVRLRQAADSGALPAANAVMIHVLADLYAATGEGQWRDKAASITGAFGQGLLQQPSLYEHLIHGMMRIGSPEPDWLAPVDMAQITGQGEADSLAPEIHALPALTQAPTGIPRQEESKDKVSIRTSIAPERSTDRKKVVKVAIIIDEGWHLNANPASLDTLIPTVVDIQTRQKSTLQVDYPHSRKLATPLGLVDVYEDTVEITATVESSEPIDESTMRALVQVQACKDALCYPPSQVAVDLE